MRNKLVYEREIVLTNLLHFGPTTIAALYKDRLEIDLFFKALKQNLKVKSFVGNSFDYLTELQRHAQELAANPAAWMPWNYRQTLEPHGV